MTKSLWLKFTVIFCISKLVKRCCQNDKNHHSSDIICLLALSAFQFCTQNASLCTNWGNVTLAMCCPGHSYPAGSESVVDSVVPLLVCSAAEVVLGLESGGAVKPRVSWPGEGLPPLLLLAAEDRPDGEDGGGVWRAKRQFSSPLDVNSTLSEG